MSTQNEVDRYKNEHVTRRYSEGFKLKILSELSTDKYIKRELSRIYGIQSSTVNEWIKKYDRKDFMNTRIMIENKDEIMRLKELTKEIEQLKKLLQKKDLDQLVNDSYLEAAAELLGYKTVAELKKKLNTKH
jgi:transposase-like protein